MTITPTKTAVQNAAIRSPESSESDIARTMRRTSSPIRKNTVFSRSSWIVAQLTRSLSRDWPVWMIGDLWPRTRPATTTAMTPDPW